MGRHRRLRARSSASRTSSRCAGSRDLGAVALEQADMREHLEHVRRVGRRGAHRGDRHARQLHVAALQERRRAGVARRRADGAGRCRRSPSWHWPPSCTTSARWRYPTSILLKARPVDDDEWEIMKQYPLRGAEMLERVPGPGERLPDRPVRAGALGRRRLPARPEGRGRYLSPAASSWPATPTTRWSRTGLGDRPEVLGGVQASCAPARARSSTPRSSSS